MSVTCSACSSIPCRSSDAQRISVWLTANECRLTTSTSVTIPSAAGRCAALVESRWPRVVRASVFENFPIDDRLQEETTPI